MIIYISKLLYLIKIILVIFNNINSIILLYYILNKMLFD